MPIVYHFEELGKEVGKLWKLRTDFDEQTRVMIDRMQQAQEYITWCERRITTLEMELKNAQDARLQDQKS